MLDEIWFMEMMMKSQKTAIRQLLWHVKYKRSVVGFVFLHLKGCFIIIVLSTTNSVSSFPIHSGVDRFKQEFAHLEEHNSQGDRSSPILRHHASLPR